MGPNFDYCFKVLLLGDSGVGKTQLLDALTGSEVSDFLSSMGFDFRTRYHHVDGKRIKFQIWNTAGQERFRTATPAHFRGAHVILLCYDPHNQASFNHIQGWHAEALDHAEPNVIFYVISINQKLDQPLLPNLPHDPTMPLISISLPERQGWFDGLLTEMYRAISIKRFQVNPSISTPFFDAHGQPRGGNLRSIQPSELAEELSSFKVFLVAPEGDLTSSIFFSKICASRVGNFKNSEHFPTFEMRVGPQSNLFFQIHLITASDFKAIEGIGEPTIGKIILYCFDANEDDYSALARTLITRCQCTMHNWESILKWAVPVVLDEIEASCAEEVTWLGIDAKIAVNLQDTEAFRNFFDGLAAACFAKFSVVPPRPASDTREPEASSATAMPVLPSASRAFTPAHRGLPPPPYTVYAEIGGSNDVPPPPAYDGPS